MDGLKRPTAVMVTVYCLCLLFAMVYPTVVFSAQMPEVVGITNGSVYTSQAKVIWYPRSGCSATVRRDGGSVQSVSWGTRLSNGTYELVVVDDSDPDTYRKTLNFVVASDNPGGAVIQTHSDQTGAVVTFEYHRGVISRPPLCAVWAEDISGNVVQNLFVTGFPSNNMPPGGTSRVERPANVPRWTHLQGTRVASGRWLADPANNIPEDLDAVSGATQKDDYTVIARLKQGAYPQNRARIFFEVNQSFNYGWYFTQSMTSHVGEPSVIYSVEVATDRAGTYDLGGTELNVNPVGYGDYRGNSGEMYTDFYSNGRYIFDHAPGMTEFARVTVTPAGQTNNPPQARFSADPQSGVAPLQVAFNNTSSDDGAIASFQWDFGDNTSTDDQWSPTHTYTAAGRYTVSLRVTDDGNPALSATRTLDIVVQSGNQAPKAGFTATPAGGPAPLEVSFENTSTDDGTIASYQWNFGDGTGSNNQWSPTHTYTQPGRYTISLRVTDDGNPALSDTETVQILVTEETIEDETPPSVPQNLSDRAVSATTVELAWDASSDNTGGVGLAGYTVYRMQNDTAVRLHDTVNPESLVDGLTPQTNYTFAVSAYDTRGNESARSQPLTVTTLPQPSGDNLINDNTFVEHGQGLSDRCTINNLWDGDLGDSDSGIILANAEPFWVGFDFGKRHTLDRIRLHGDNSYSFQCARFNVLVKENESDTYQIVVDEQQCNQKRWFDIAVPEIKARYLMLEVFGPNNSVEVKEFEVYGRADNDPPPVNHPPVLAPIGDKTVRLGNTLSFALSATDPDTQDTLTYIQQGLPCTNCLNPKTGAFSWTPDTAPQQPYTVTFSVYDNAAPPAGDSETVRITVVEPQEENHAPEMGAIAPQSVKSGDLLTFTVSATDPDGDKLVFSAANLPAGASLDTTTGVFAWRPTAQDKGTHTVTFTVSDDGDPVLTDSAAATITVKDGDIVDDINDKIDDAKDAVNCFISTIQIDHE